MGEISPFSSRPSLALFYYTSRCWVAEATNPSILNLAFQSASIANSGPATQFNIGFFILYFEVLFTVHNVYRSESPKFSCWECVSIPPVYKLYHSLMLVGNMPRHISSFPLCPQFSSKSGLCLEAHLWSSPAPTHALCHKNILIFLLLVSGSSARNNYVYTD